MSHTHPDADRLRRVAGNLLSKARVHIDPSMPVLVTIETSPETVVLQVADEGPGIAPEHARRGTYLVSSSDAKHTSNQ